MRPKISGLGSRSSHAVVIIGCLALLSPSYRVVLAQGTEPQNATPTESAAPAEEAPKIPNDQLDSLVAPIALYPDPLLAQTLAASTYPLEIIQLEQWMNKNKNLKGKALADAVEKQNWDPSVQAMAVFPDVVKQLAENVSWSSDLGNAFLAQEADVMDAVQRMRAKAQGAGNLKSSQQQKVESKTVESKNVIVIEQADPQIVYVPSYNPTVVYGAPAYPYPSIYYPPGYGLLAFGTGVAIGAAWGNGGWGWGCGWGHGDVNINVNNKYVNNYNKNNYNKANFNKQGGQWQHNPQHRGSAPYGNRNTANRYGGNARQQPASGAGNRPGGGGAGIANRPGGGGAGTANRPGGGAGANRPGGGGAGIANRPGGGGAGTANRPGGGGAGVATRPSGGAGATRPGGSGTGTRPGGGASTRPAGAGGANKVGNRSVPSGASSHGGAFGSGGGGHSGNYARASSSRGGSSMGGGGGYSRGGGSYGGSRGGGYHGGGGGGGRGGGRK